MSASLAAAILAGGASRRMGTDKALLRTGTGQTLLERTIAVAREAGLSPILVIGRVGEDAPDGSVRFVPDPPERAGVGPLGGIATALEAVPGDAILALPCDLPFLTPDALHWLRRAWEERAPGVVAVTIGRDADGDHPFDPLFAVYGADCLPVACERLANGWLSGKGLLQAVPAAFPLPPLSVRETLADVDTSEEWYAAQRRREAGNVVNPPEAA